MIPKMLLFILFVCLLLCTSSVVAFVIHIFQSICSCCLLVYSLVVTILKLIFFFLVWHLYHRCFCWSCPYFTPIVAVALRLPHAYCCCCCAVTSIVVVLDFSWHSLEARCLTANAAAPLCPSPASLLWSVSWSGILLEMALQRAVNLVIDGSSGTPPRNSSNSFLNYIHCASSEIS